jgi:hypothetical protein
VERLIVDNRTQRNIAKVIMNRIFKKQGYYDLGQAIINQEEGRLEYLVRRAARYLSDVDEDIIIGICRLFALVLEHRPIASLIEESEEFQLGRIREFCEQCADGMTDEIRNLSLEQLPVWLRHK